MKKGALLIAVLLIFVPSVLSISNIDEISKDYYNLGDKIEIKGYILETEDTWGLFKIDLDCDKKTTLLSKTVSLKANEKTEFEEKLPIPYSISGNCKIIMSLLVGENVVEQVESNSFVITKELDGSFEISETMIQLGDEIYIEGIITKKDNSKVNGIATLYFKKEGINVFVDILDVTDGRFKYDFDSSSKPAGMYNLEVFVSDVFGNEKLFTNIPSLNIVNEIYVVAKPNKETVLPGSIIGIFGEVKTVLQKEIKKAEVIVILDEIQYNGKVSDGEFNQRIRLSSLIKSGEHTAHVIVEDELGNIGETDTKFIVEAIPTLLKVDVLNGPFKPGDKILVIPGLYDQANDLISESINVGLLDNKGVEIKTNEILSGNQIEFEVPNFAIPGNWYIYAKASGLETKEDILIGEISMIDLSIDNQTLVVSNIGNIKYRGYIDIYVTGSGGESSISESISLKPSKEKRIDLGYEIEKNGVYNIKVGDKEFKDVRIISKQGLFKYDFLYYVVVVLFVGFLVWLFLFKHKPKVRKKKKAIKKEVKDISEVKVEKDEKKKFAEAFKEMALKSIGEEPKKKKFGLFKRKDKKDAGIVRLDKDHYKKKEEKRVEEALWGKKKKDDEESGGLFNMFG